MPLKAQGSLTPQSQSCLDCGEKGMQLTVLLSITGAKVGMLTPGAARCVCVPSHFSRVRLCATLWTVARQAPLSMGILQARTLE